jgi:hypothetical protein
MQVGQNISLIVMRVGQNISLIIMMTSQMIMRSLMELKAHMVVMNMMICQMMIRR